MFESLNPVAMDPILGLMAAFRADARTNKIDLGVGVYMNDRGHTPVMTSVKEAETHDMRRIETVYLNGHKRLATDAVMRGMRIHRGQQTSHVPGIDNGNLCNGEIGASYVCHQ